LKEPARRRIERCRQTREGFEPKFVSADELAARMRSYSKRWGRLIRSRLGSMPPPG
jgi:hypothetical protein